MPNLQDRVLETLAAIQETDRGMTCREVKDALGGEYGIPAINLTMYRLRDRREVRKSWHKNEQGEHVWFFQEDTGHMNKTVLDWWNMLVELNSKHPFKHK